MNKSTITLRPPQPGDMGWVVQQHGEIYWREYGWDMRFEALVAGIVSGYVTNHQSDFEKCWIAEVDGVRAGSAFVVRKSKTTAHPSWSTHCQNPYQATAPCWAAH